MLTKRVLENVYHFQFSFSCFSPIATVSYSFSFQSSLVSNSLSQKLVLFIVTSMVN